MVRVVVTVGVSASLLRCGLRSDAGGGEPGVELGGVAAVEVLHHGVEAGDFLAGFEEEDVDAGVGGL